MELRHLRYFQAVAEELSFSRASRRLRVAQPAISRAVKELEEELGAMVLERSRHHVRLTPAGSVLLRETALLLDRFDEGLRRAKRTGLGQEGELRLGYIGPPTQRFLGPLLRAYRENHPEVAIHLEERTPERTWEMVSRRRLAAAITRPVAGHESLGLRTMHLRDEPLGALFPADHPLAARRRLPWADLREQPLILLARREGMGLHDAVLGGCRQAGFAPRVAQTPSLISAVGAYVEAGVGVGIVPDCVLDSEGRMAFVPLVPQQSVPLVLVWHEDEDSPAVRQFRELLTAWRETGKLWPSSKREGDRPRRAGRR